MLPRGWWKDKGNQLRKLQELEKDLGITAPEGWYKMAISDLFKFDGGKSLLKQYNNSIFHMLQALRPEYKWIPWNFSQVPRNFWKSKENVRSYLEAFAVKDQNQVSYAANLYLDYRKWTYQTKNAFKFKEVLFCIFVSNLYSSCSLNWHHC